MAIEFVSFFFGFSCQNFQTLKFIIIRANVNLFPVLFLFQLNEISSNVWNLGFDSILMAVVVAVMKVMMVVIMLGWGGPTIIILPLPICLKDF